MIKARFFAKRSLRRQECLRQNSVGFTLIELLVVVAIIAVLIAMLLPSLSQAREKAKQIVCASGFQQIGTTFELYLNDYAGWYPGWVQGPFSVGPDVEFFWYQVLIHKGYLNDRKVLFCPTHIQMQDSDYLYNNGYISIGYNVCLSVDYTVYPSVFRRTIQSQVNQPSRGVLAVDAQHYSTGLGTFMAYPSDRRGASGDDKMAFPRHSGTCNVVWLDGHVSVVAAPDKTDYSSIYRPGALTSMWEPWGNFDYPWNPRK